MALIISAPFGNYLTFPNAISTIGTYTLAKRAGFWKRLWKIISTIRYHHDYKSWTNRLGLPNPGIDALMAKYDRLGSRLRLSSKILSILGFTKDEWTALAATKIQYLHDLKLVELNLSCPNHNSPEPKIEDIETCIKLLTHYDKAIIAKLGPNLNAWDRLGSGLYQAGIRCFHLCNTLPSKMGGVSGKILKPFSLIAIEYFRKIYGGSVILIGGGGITSPQDIIDYRNAGADHVSIASTLINPFNWSKVKNLAAAALARNPYDFRRETNPSLSGIGQPY